MENIKVSEQQKTSLVRLPKLFLEEKIEFWTKRPKTYRIYQFPKFSQSKPYFAT